MAWEGKEVGGILLSEPELMIQSSHDFPRNPKMTQNNPTLFPTEDSRFLITGPAGMLDVATTEPKIPSCGRTAIIAHPHPLHGGTMDNKVVTTLMRAYSGLGLRVVRFNYRGVGQSEGQFDNAVGEVQDLLAVIAWVKTVLPTDKLWLSGFSFGAYVAAKVTNDIQDVEQLVTIAPAVTNYNFDDITQVKCPWLLVQGDEDEVIDAQKVFEWVEQSPLSIDVVTMKGAGHYFHGRLVELREILQERLKARCEAP